MLVLDILRSTTENLPLKELSRVAWPVFNRNREWLSCRSLSNSFPLLFVLYETHVVLWALTSPRMINGCQVD